MSATFRALDLVFSVVATDPAMQELVDHLYDACRSSDEPTTQFTLLERGTDTTKITFCENDQRLLTTGDESFALAHLVWRVNQQAVAASGSRVLLHAAAAARHGRAVLLPARSGAGKSTLVAALVAAGFDYLTDDVCAIDPDGGHAIPYPKPIAIAAAMVPRFEGLGVLITAGDRTRFVGEDAFLSAADLGGSVAGERVAARLVVEPEFVAGAPTRLQALTRAETAVLLAEQSFNFNALGAEALLVIADLLRGCTCYRLTYSDLAGGVTRVSELLDEIA